MRVCQTVDIDELAAQLTSGSYRWSPVAQAKIPKGNGKYRLLGLSEPLDQIVSRAVLRPLQDCCEHLLNEHNYAYRRGHDTAMAAVKLLEMSRMSKGVILKLDLEDFFGSIRRGELLRRLQAMTRCDGKLLRLTKNMLWSGIRVKGRITVPKRGVTQGQILSPMLASWIYANPIDGKLAELGHYVRYSDDLAFAVNSVKEAESLVKTIERILGENKLKINPAKTRMKPITETTFLGFGFSRDGLCIPDGAWKKLSEMLNEGHRDDTVRVCRRVKGWISYYRHADSRLPTDQDIDRLETMLSRAGLQLPVMWRRSA